MGRQLALFALALAGASAFGAVERLQKTADTCFLLGVRDGALADLSGRGFKPVVKGAEVFKDPEMGEAIRFVAPDGKCGVTVPDDGTVSFKDGVTVEALVYLETYPEKSCVFACKRQKAWTLTPFLLTLGRRLVLDHLSFKGEPIDWTEYEGMHKWKFHPDATYTGVGNRMNGLYDIVTGRWTHVAFTYSPKIHHLATWVDRGVDREAYNPQRGLFGEVVHDPAAPFQFFAGAKGLRVAQIRVAARGEDVGHNDPLKVYVSELAYRGYGYVHVEPATENLPLPFEISVENVRPPTKSLIAKYVVNDLGPHNFRIPSAEFKNTTTELIVRMVKDGRELWKYETLIGNLSAGSPTSYRMIRCQNPVKGPFVKHPDWWIETDNTITYRGKPVFPIMISHVQTNDLDTVFDLGFNMVGVSRPPKMNTFDITWKDVVRACCEKAAARGAWITVGSDVEDRPGEGFLYAFDEPWGHSFAPMFQTYRALRSARERPAELPVTGGQNNGQRYRETGCVTDVLAVDPYWNGRGPLRWLYDAVRNAIRDTDGLKPITLDVGNYGPRASRQTYDDLRTMSYLGVIAGCRALYYYTWDDGPGTNTAEMPDVCADYKRLFGEFAKFNEALVVPNDEPGPAADEATEGRGLFVCAKVVKKSRRVYLFAVSDLYRPSSRTVIYPALAGKTLKLASGPDRPGASPELSFDAQGRAKVDLPPLGCAIYVGEGIGKREQGTEKGKRK